MEIISATVFTLPRATKTNAIIRVTSDPFIGSLSFFRPFDNHVFTPLFGKALSDARA